MILTHDWLCFEYFKIWRYFRESNSLSCQTSSEPSAFRESPLSPSQVANYLRDELKRLRKRRQLAEMPSTSRSPPASPGSPEPMMADLDRASPNSLAGPSSPKSVHVMTKTPTKNGDRPVFTLKQMTMICEKMCKVYFTIHLNIDNISLNMTFYLFVGTHRSGSWGVRPNFAAEALGAIRLVCKVRRSANPTKIQPISTTKLFVLNWVGRMPISPTCKLMKTLPNNTSLVPLPDQRWHEHFL